MRTYMLKSLYAHAIMGAQPNKTEGDPESTLVGHGLASAGRPPLHHPPPVRLADPPPNGPTPTHVCLKGFGPESSCGARSPRPRTMFA